MYDITIEVGAIAAAAISVIAFVWKYFYTLRQERKSLAAAFSGEIYTILQTIKNRQYGNIFTDILENIRNDKLSLFDTPLFTINLGIAFPMYRTQIKNIGFLPSELSKKIILFYGNIFALLEDTQNSPRLYHDQANTNASGDLEATKDSYYRMWEKTCNKDIEILSATIELGNEIKTELDKFVNKGILQMVHDKINTLILVGIFVILAYLAVSLAGTGRYIPFGSNQFALLDTRTGAVYSPESMPDNTRYWKPYLPEVK